MSDNNENELKSEFDIMKLHIDLMFSKYIDHEPAQDIQTISEYFQFIRKGIDHNKGEVDIDQSLIEQFEAICLLLKDRLLLYPEPLRIQIFEILKDDKLTQFFGVLATLDEDERLKLRRLHNLDRFIYAFLRFFGRVPPPSGISIYKLWLTPEGLLNTKIALNRLSQILKYAATIELLDYDTGQSEFREHYDPDLVDKPKLIALINILRVQAKSIPDKEIKDKIFERVDQLENEVRKHKPRWGRIIAGFFILFGFISNLKTLSPETYDQLYTTAQKIVVTLHEEGQTHKEKKSPMIPLDNNNRYAVIPQEVSIKQTEDENEISG